MPENTIAKIVELCRLKGIPVSRLEKDLGFGNGSLNPDKSTDIKAQRLFKVLNYLGVSFEEFFGMPVVPPEERKNPATDSGEEKSNSVVDEKHAYINGIFDQLTFENQIRAANELQSLLQSQSIQDDQ